MKTKIISYLLIISMIMTGVAYAAEGLNLSNEDSTYGQGIQKISNVNANDENQSFPDIKNHWCQSVIEKFVAKGWVVGYDDGLFRPDIFVTRAEFTAMVVNIFKEEKKVEGSSFTDVNKSDWFYNAVSYAASEGLVAGYEDGTFKPMANMQRQDAAVLVSRLFEVDFFEGADEFKFKDEDTFPEYSYQSIKNLASHEIVRGYPDGTFKPYNLITRAEAVQMLNVVLKYIEVPEETPPLVPPETATPTKEPESTPEPTTTSTPKPSTPSTGGGSKPKPTPTGVSKIYRTYTTTKDFEEGIKINLSSQEIDCLKLDETTKTFNYMWVAVSSKGTVVKINTDTGEILGEYRTAPEGQPLNPSRTTVDHEGNVWVANRDGNSVVKQDMCLLMLTTMYG
ncbi:S-layer homology domain-containing protein [Acetivibrio saccincola]|uniref:Cellulosome-anchoring protein n=1 Tax=Acetivibrio saccincola TaxID=1677857 RepID=A0A2K9E3F4_9FIRM|nr:S-layer homology domain-containing protein [Acetivibrio saccincola]AUG56908.1 Cellulosome-anchoring protein precursor [Acetivibrio saccincola]